MLLGLARGDDSVPGIGERKMSEIRPEERTTPAGRFNSEPGINLQGEDIVWIDYDAAVSMHRVRTNNKKERRLERLASAHPEDHRIPMVASTFLLASTMLTSSRCSAMHPA